MWLLDVLRQAFLRSFPWPNPDTGPTISDYQYATVLPVSWETDDFPIRCTQELEKVVETFRTYYGYTIDSDEIYKIPLEGSQGKLQQRVTEFIDRNSCDGGRNLLILYYSGHGGPGGWAPNSKRNGSSTIEWDKIQPILEKACTKSDVLVVLDCCHAKDIVKTATPPESHIRLEFLLATTNGKTLRPGTGSFTNLFTDELLAAENQDRGVMVSHLPDKISQRAHEASKQTPLSRQISPNWWPCHRESTGITLKPLANTDDWVHVETGPGGCCALPQLSQVCLRSI